MAAPAFVLLLLPAVRCQWIQRLAKTREVSCLPMISALVGMDGNVRRGLNGLEVAT